MEVVARLASVPVEIQKPVIGSGKDKKALVHSHKRKRGCLRREVFEIGNDATDRAAVRVSKDERWDRSHTEREEGNMK